MSKKQEFISYVETLIENNHELEMSENARLYWEALKDKEEKEKPLFTDNGKLILKYLQENQTVSMWKSKDIAEGILLSSRSVSGAMQKLAKDGFVEKVGKDPIIYCLTENGKKIEII